MTPTTEGNIWLTTVAPILGAILATAMYLSPMKVVLSVMDRKELGDLNPIPMGFIVANCAGWLGYSYVTGDTYVYFANQPGLLFGLFMTIGCVMFANQKQRYILQGMVVGSGLIIGVVGFVSVKVAAATCADVDGVCPESRLLWGYTANIILFFYYGAPLSVVYRVVKERNSAFLYWPLALASLLNATLWVAYGGAVSDPFIWLPNFVGVIFTLIQLALVCIFPAKSVREPKDLDRESGTEGLIANAE